LFSFSDFTLSAVHVYAVRSKNVRKSSHEHTRKKAPLSFLSLKEREDAEYRHATNTSKERERERVRVLFERVAGFRFREKRERGT
jgi:hypothetical protein